MIAPRQAQSQLLVESRPAEGVALILIDNPPVNALSAELYGALSEMVTRLEDASDVRSVVLASAHPRVFVAGADLRQLDHLELRGAKVAERLDRARTTFLRLQRLSKPTVAAIEGHALGGGCELALSLDFRLMSRGPARIGLPEAGLGLIPGAGGTQRLARLIGREAAAEMMMLARRVDADEGERLGLVRACDDARAVALRRASELAAMPATSIALIKECLNDGYDGDLLRGLSIERGAAIAAFESPAAREGIAAFREKRRPRFH